MTCKGEKGKQEKREGKEASRGAVRQVPTWLVP